jgi:hypothetical protein
LERPAWTVLPVSFVAQRSRKLTLGPEIKVL